MRILELGDMKKLKKIFVLMVSESYVEKRNSELDINKIVKIYKELIVDKLTWRERYTSYNR